MSYGSTEVSAVLQICHLSVMAPGRRGRDLKDKELALENGETWGGGDLEDSRQKKQKKCVKCQECETTRSPRFGEPLILLYGSILESEEGRR